MTGTRRLNVSRRRNRRLPGVALCVLAVIAAAGTSGIAAGRASAQTSDSRISAPRNPASRAPEPRVRAGRAPSAAVFNAGLRDVDRLLEDGRLSEAAASLDHLRRAGADEQSLRLRWIRLHDAAGDHAAMIAACRQGLATAPGDKRLREALVAGLASIDSLDAARREADLYLGAGAVNLVDASGLIDLWRTRGHPEEGLALCDRLRERRSDPRLFARNRARCLAALERYGEAAGEFVKVLEINPLDVSPVRRDLEAFIVGRDAIRAYREGLDGLGASDHPAVNLLSVDAALRLGRGEAAIEILDGGARTVREDARLLRLARILASELGTYRDAARARATGLWLLHVLEPGGLSDEVFPRRAPARTTLLAEVCQTLLGGIVPRPDRDPAAAQTFLAAIREALLRVRREDPACEMLYLAQIRMADYQRDALGDPAAAAADLQALLEDLDLPIAGFAQATLSLGKAHLAAADTSRARRVFSRLSEDERFPVIGLDADYLLGLLDIAQGHWETGRERLADLAGRSPEADVTNDALDMGLRIAELEMEPDPDPGLREAFGRDVLWKLLDRPEERARNLERLAGIASGIDSPAAASTNEYAHMELALLELGFGRPAAAEAHCDTLVANHPDGRYPARAMLMKAFLQDDAGDARGAARTREILLVQYPDSPQAESAREALEEK